MNKKTTDWVGKHFETLETIFILGLSVSLFLTYKEIAQALYGCFGFLILLAILYMLMMLRPFETKVAPIRYVIRKVVYMSYVFGTLSIIPVLQFDPEVDAKTLCIATLCFLGASMVLLVLKRVKMKESAGFVSNMIRCMLFTLILTWILLIFI
ncbi:MAG: hypothetical protein MJZ66_10940 [Bacteroidales bacterium]|nr:hypothetical protein [Bacteroidales bacterium]